VYVYVYVCACVFCRYVGQAEENIRNLFVDAEIEYKEKGDASDLHIIIFDEIDAICKVWFLNSVRSVRVYFLNPYVYRPEGQWVPELVCMTRW